MYRRKLKKQIKNELMRDERTYETLDELIEIFIDFDEKLYERVMKKKYDEKSQGRVEIYFDRLSSSYFEESNFDKRRRVKSPSYQGIRMTWVWSSGEVCQGTIVRGSI